MEEHADSAANAAKMTRCDEDKKAERAKLSAVAAAVEVERKQVQDPFRSLTHAPILPLPTRTQRYSGPEPAGIWGNSDTLVIAPNKMILHYTLDC